MVEWWIVLVGVLAGFAFRTKGFAIPVLVALGWWVFKLVTGDLSSSRGEDDYAAEALASAVVGMLCGCLGVGVGVLLRWLVDRSLSPRETRLR